ncbi:Oligopeptide ABC transporter, periplasmic oligopeptide-binding protein OppA [Lachnospiraceae bacterium TWA4]|nr:Oligopeptide ABC transporter, periplasmic oligopeptide-binding protein OppA [Lachnospiraceae bacterium TWA4]
MRKVFNKILAVSLAATMTFGIAGCSSTPKETTKGTENAKTTEAVSTQAQTITGDLSNTLVYAGESESTINPILNNHDELPDLIFSGLMKYDGNNKPICDIAEKYDYDQANETYTFTIRDGIKWHDGTEFTVDDIVYTYEVLTKDETLSASILSNYEDIDTVTAPDAKTVVIKMKKHNAAMLNYFTMGILPKHLTEGKDINTMDFNQNPVGTGRYKFVEWDNAGGMIILEKNNDYYDKVPNIEKVVYKTVSQESTKATMLQSGEADLAWLNANYAESFRGNDAYKNIDYTTADYRAMSMDFRTDFWKKNGDSIGVLNYALNKDAIIAGVLAGKGVAAYSPIQLSNFGGNKDADIYSYDLNKFASEMEKLGWKKGSDGIYERNGEKFHFTIQVRDYEEERVDIAKICSSQLKEAGVDMEVVLVTKFDWEAGYNGFLSGYAAQFDPDQFYSNYVTGASSNNMEYSNAEVDKLLTEGRHAASDEDRQKAYSEFEKVYAQAPGVVLVAFLEGNYVSTKALDGLDTTRVLGHHSVGVLWNIENWTLNK